MKNLVGLAILLATSIAHGDSSKYLYVWTADADRTESDFIAVINANPHSETYGDVLTTLEVGSAAGAHHTEHRMPDGGVLFMNGFRSGQSFVLDLNDPLAPSVVSRFDTVGELSYAHSFERLPNSNVLATFQNGPNGERTTGGIAEFDSSGNVVRWVPATVSGFPEIRPYSLAILPSAGVALTTTADMRAEAHSDAVQVWRLSDLALIHTLRLPASSRSDDEEWPLEPRLMDDGETLIVNTSRCGLYKVSGLDSNEPVISHIYSFARQEGLGCSLPVTVGPYWIQTVGSRYGIVSLDLSDPTQPKEVGFVGFGTGNRPHWIAIEPNNQRIVVTGFGDMRNSIMMVKIDMSDGSLTLDQNFGKDGVVDFSRNEWPHGPNGAAVPHGSVFSVREIADN